MSVSLRIETELADELATRRLGALVAAELSPGDTVVLTGELGAGKTTLVKGLVGALDDSCEVTSPTFALCHRYDCDPPVAHVDCWRMERAAELDDLALDELLDEGWVALIEWGERLGDRFPGALRVTLSAAGRGRHALLESDAERWREPADRLRAGCSRIEGDRC